MKKSYIILLLIILIGIIAGTMYYTKEEEVVIEKSTDRSGIVVDTNVVYRLTPPEDWLMDNRAGQEQGLPAVFYKNTELWTNALTVMYANSVSLTENKLTHEELIKKDIETFIGGDKGFVVTDGKPIPIAEGVVAKVKLLSNKAKNTYEAMAYINVQDRVEVIIVLHSKTEEQFNATLPLFENVVKSYVLVDDLQMK